MKVQLGLYNQRFRIGVDVKVLPNRWEIRLTGDSRRLELPDGILAVLLCIFKAKSLLVQIGKPWHLVWR